jgi:hypothetical protein
VLDVVRHCDLIDKFEPALVRDLVIKAANGLFVVTLVSSQLTSLLNVRLLPGGRAATDYRTDDVPGRPASP